MMASAAPARATTFGSSPVAPIDTCVSSANAADHSHDSHLDVGLFSSGDLRRALIKFDLCEIPPGAKINSATLKLCLTTTTLGAPASITCSPVLGGWSLNSTWGSTFGNQSLGLGSGADIAASVTTNKSVTWDVAPIVQKWFDGSLQNNGFALASANESGCSPRTFYASEYLLGSALVRPQIVVDYTPPTLTLEPVTSACRAGGLVRVAVHASSRYVSSMQLRVDARSSATGPATQNCLSFTTAPQSAPWVSLPVPGGYLSYQRPSAGSATSTTDIVPDLAASTFVTRPDGLDATFAYRAAAGACSDLRHDQVWVREPDWQGSWQDAAIGYDVLPSSVTTASAATTASAGWFQERDADGDGLADVPDDTQASGRGAVRLAWRPTPFASRYEVFLFDGSRYRCVATTSATAWGSAGQRLYPSDSAIASLSTAPPISPFSPGTGLDLRDDPRPLYRATSPGTGVLAPAYSFKVVAVDAAGEMPVSEAPTVTVALEGRTVHLHDAPHPAVLEAGDLFGDAAEVELPSRAFSLHAVDLALPGTGPDVTLERHYSTVATGSTTFGSGWRFNFEQCVQSNGASCAAYVESNGTRHEFVRASSVWVAAAGDFDSLAGDAQSGWLLTRKGGATLEFDAQGRMTASRDANGTVVHFDWTSDSLTIRAPGDVWLAHERRIVVRFENGTVVSARLVTPDGERTVAYETSANTCTVTANVGTAECRVTVYGYRAGRIATVSVPGAIGSQRAPATWTIGGVPGESVLLENTTGAGTPPMRREVVWRASGCAATTTLAGGSTQTVSWDPLGREVARSVAASSAQTLTRYDVLGDVSGQTSPTGRSTGTVFDERGNALVEQDELGRLTSNRYENDRCVEQRDPNGALTTRTYDKRGNLLSERRTLDASGTLAASEWTYDDAGRLVSERRQVDASTWATTRYDDFAECGEAGAARQLGVRLSSGADPIDLVERKSFDAFGDLVAHVGADGVTDTRTAFDAAGRPVEVTDSTGTVTHLRYGALGDVAERWRSNPATSTRADWVVSEFNGAGQVTTETAKASDGATVSVTTHTYDAAGREVRTDASDVPGQGVTTYDAGGTIAGLWAEGSNTATAAASVRVSQDGDGEITSERMPGSVTAASEFGYGPDGELSWERESDGRLTSFGYDASGDVSSMGVASEACTATVRYDVDLAGRATSETAMADGATTAHAYDLQGDEVATRLGTQGPSTIEHNTLGWELRREDFDHVVSDTGYDPEGRAVTVRRGGTVTQSKYDASGREVSRLNDDGSALERVFDEFGRLIVERHTANGSDISRTTFAYDTAGRLSRTGESVTGLVCAYSYGPTGTVTMARGQSGGPTLAVQTDGAGIVASESASLGATRIDWSAVATDTAQRVIDASSTATHISRVETYDDAGRVTRDAIGAYRFSAAGHKTGETLAFRMAGVSEDNRYSYDAIGRLVDAVVGGAHSTYVYAAGSGAVSAMARSGVTTSLAYDGAGRLSTATASGAQSVYRSDADGERISAGPTSNPLQTRYSWAGGRLVSVVGPAGVVHHAYNADGTRVRSVIASGSAITTVTYTYDGGALAAVCATVSQGPGWSIAYLDDPRGKPDSAIYRSDLASGIAFGVETTDRGDVRELLDARGTAFALYCYDAYGNPTGVQTCATALVNAATASEIARRQPLRYAGYVWDAESALYCLGQRYYDPAVATFISRDPDKSDGEASLFRYCADDPVSNTDPGGRTTTPLRTGSLSAAVFDQVRERIVYGAFFVVHHSRGYAPDNATQGCKGAPNGYTDCSGLVTWILSSAGVLSKSTITGWNSRNIYDHAPTRSTHPTNGAFDSSRKTPWQIGDILQSDPPHNHVAIVVRDSPDPYIAESSPTYHGPAIHKISKRKSNWKFQHAGRFFTRRRG